MWRSEAQGGRLNSRSRGPADRGRRFRLGAAGGRKFFDGDGYRQIAKKIAAFLVSGV